MRSTSCCLEGTGPRSLRLRNTCAGKHYTVNVPLKDGMDDDNYKFMYEPIMAKASGHTPSC